MTGDPGERRTPPTEPAEALAAQIRDVRDTLRDDATSAGIDVARVDTAVDTALASYADARVHGFIGVFVERDVRSALDLPRSGSTGATG